MACVQSQKKKNNYRTRRDILMVFSVSKTAGGREKGKVVFKAEVWKAKEPFGETACRTEGKAKPKLPFDGEKPSGKLSLTCLSTVLFYYTPAQIHLSWENH